MSETKPRIRVPAVSRRDVEVLPPAAHRSMRPTARYLEDRTGVLNLRRAVTRDAAIDVRESAERAAGIALSFLHNSGWIAGAANQVIVDTIGTELKLNLRPDLSAFGYDEKETSDWCRLVEQEWRLWSWNAAECDLAGKATIAEMADGVMRHYLAYGEGIGVISYLGAAARRAYGVETGTKVSLISPHRLPRRTSEMEGMVDGIFHDANGRPTHYRFRRRESGFERDVDLPATDGTGLSLVLHVMDRGENPGAARGISPVAPAMKAIAQFDQAADATLSNLLLQQAFAAVITSPEPSEEAFKALQSLADTDMPVGWQGGQASWEEFIGGLQSDFVDVWGQRIEALKKGGVNLSNHSRVAHMGPGEDLKFLTANGPGANYLPFVEHMHRETARCMGVTATSLTMNFNGSTYSSVRMETATIWPLAIRRRERIAAPFVHGVFIAWLDEKVATGRIPFKGGYRAFAAARERVAWAEWQGPAAPSADDYKAAMASTERLENGTSSLADECALSGRDWETMARQRARERKIIVDELGLPDPFERMSGGAGPNGAAAEGRREQKTAMIRQTVVA